MPDRLVWVLGVGGRLDAQKWPADMPSGCTLGQTVVAEHRLNNLEAQMALSDLAERYPAPELDGVAT